VLQLLRIVIIAHRGGGLKSFATGSSGVLNQCRRGDSEWV
jgi:hypothetical protein